MHIPTACTCIYMLPGERIRSRGRRGSWVIARDVAKETLGTCPSLVRPASRVTPQRHHLHLHNLHLPFIISQDFANIFHRNISKASTPPLINSDSKYSRTSLNKRDENGQQGSRNKTSPLILCKNIRPKHRDMPTA